MSGSGFTFTISVIIITIYNCIYPLHTIENNNLNELDPLCNLLDSGFYNPINQRINLHYEMVALLYQSPGRQIVKLIQSRKNIL